VEDAEPVSVARSTGFDRFIGALTKCARVCAIAQLPGPHPSDRACRLCGAVGADRLALYRRTHRISPNEDQGYFISIIKHQRAMNYTTISCVGGNRTAEAAGNAGNFAIGGFDGGFIGNKGVILPA